MNPPDASWNVMISVAVGAIVAGMIKWNDYKAERRAERRAKEQSQRDAARKEENEAIKEGHKEVLKAVNGPLGQLLASHATALERIARGSELPADILAADSARKASNKHNEDMAVSEAATARDKAIEQKIIDEFLAKQK